MNSKFLREFLMGINLTGYRDSFKFFDRGGKGYITADDFHVALTQIQHGEPPTDGQVQELMRDYDINGDGQVTFEELVVATSRRRDKPDDDKQHAMFRNFDKDGNEALDRAELVELIKAFGDTLRDRTVDEILEDFDENKDGLLEYSEFVNMLASEKKHQEGNSNDSA